MGVDLRGMLCLADNIGCWVQKLQLAGEGGARCWNGESWSYIREGQLYRAKDLGLRILKKSGNCWRARHYFYPIWGWMAGSRSCAGTAGGRSWEEEPEDGDSTRVRNRWLGWVMRRQDKDKCWKLEAGNGEAQYRRGDSKQGRAALWVASASWETHQNLTSVPLLVALFRLWWSSAGQVQTYCRVRRLQKWHFYFLWTESQSKYLDLLRGDTNKNV